MKPISWMLLAALLMVLGIEEVRLASMRKTIASLKSATAAGVAGDGTTAGERLSGNDSVPAPRRERPAPVAEKSAEENEEGSDMQKTLRKMAENPVSKSMMNQGVRAMASMWYADLIDEFGLTREEGDYFLGLKSAFFAGQQEIGLKMMGAKSAEERRALAEEMETLKEQHEEAVRTFLNHDEDYDFYEAFEARLPERQQLDGIRTSLAGAGAPLRPEQETELIDAMHRARSTQEGGTDWNGGEGLEAIASGGARQRFEQEWEVSSRRTLDEIDPVLDPAQSEAFAAYLEQLKEMQLMGLEMAEKMIRPGEADSE